MSKEPPVNIFFKALAYTIIGIAALWLVLAFANYFFN